MKLKEMGDKASSLPKLWDPGEVAFAQEIKDFYSRHSASGGAEVGRWVQRIQKASRNGDVHVL